MEKLSLAALLDEDREMVTANLARDRSLPMAQTVLEKAVDRVMYRYVEGCGDASMRDAAQYILQAMKNILPVMDLVGEARAWKKEIEQPRRKGARLRPLALILLLAGTVLVLATVLASLIGSRAGGVLAFAKVLLPVALGGGCLFWAGVQAQKPPKRKQEAPEETVRTEYLVDVEKAWHCLRGAMLQADGLLERVREESALESQRAAEAAPAGGLSGRELDLFAELLETAYADSGEHGRETISAIRFFLHNAGVETVDYETGREGWFEFLPASKPGTLRPALVASGRLLKKGMASARK